MVLLYIFVAVVIINCAYFLLFSKFSFLNISEETKTSSFPVSLVVCAKNEAENLKNHIPQWLQQNYPNFELILVNDASSDETLEVMEYFAEQNSRIQIVNVKNNEAFWANKKYALTLGIKRAKNQHLIFTDADCKSNSNAWISHMVSSFSEEKQLVLGYGGYQQLPGFLNKIIRFETLLTAIQYFSYAKVGLPYMGVGRNLAYTSKLFYDTKGFMSHIKVPSGDDDLFVNEAATKTNTAIRISESSFTYSIPKKTWKAWKLQKKRHTSTAKFYKPQHRFLLGMYYVSTLLFWLLGIVSLLLLDWKVPVILIGLRFLIQYIVIGKGAKKLKENNLIPLLPFYELFLVFIQLSIFISNSGSKPSQWK